MVGCLLSERQAIDAEGPRQGQDQGPGWFLVASLQLGYREAMAAGQLE
jgi:hypothetical protein